MSHPFGDRLSQYLHRKHGLSQAKLAAGILQAPAVISDMCNGRRLHGAQARERVLAIIDWLWQADVSLQLDEANALLAAAGMASLQADVKLEAALLMKLTTAQKSPPMVANIIHKDQPHVTLAQVTQRTLCRNLPSQLTPFIGRESEQRQIVGMLADPNCRLLTLIGVGGVGKTRLALQAIANQQSNFVDGVCFIALVPVVSPRDLAATCLEALRIDQQRHVTPDEQIIHYLAHKQLLLILDNFEHLLPETALIQAILNQASGVKLLVTSRERLKLQAEWLFPVSGLELPKEIPATVVKGDLIGLQLWSAIRLFVERAQHLDANFALTTANAAAIVQICQAVNGMPLAIELAVGWTRLLTCHEIAERINSDLDFLSSAWRDLPPRHQSLSAVFAHSWSLLSKAEQLALQQLAVFRGGFRGEAAMAVAGASLTLLSELIDKSWLSVVDKGRFDMHELIRQFVTKKRQSMLVDSMPGDEMTGDAFALHSRYYATLLHAQEPFLHSAQQLEVLSRLLVEVNNIRQGWHWAVEHVEVETIAKYLKSWQWLGEIRSWDREMMRLFGEAADRLKKHLLQLKDNVNNDENSTAFAQVSLVVARTLHCQGRHGLNLDWPAEVETICQESLAYWPQPEIASQHSNEQNHVKILLGFAWYSLAKYREAESIYHLARQECTRNHDLRGLKLVFRALGFHAFTTGRFDEAWHYFQKSLAADDQLGEQAGKVSVMCMLAEITCNQGDYERSDRIAWEIHQLSETFGIIFYKICSYNNLGYAAILRGELEQAKQYYSTGLCLSIEINADFLHLLMKRWLGNIAYQQQDYIGSQQFFAESLAIARSIHRPTDSAIALTGLAKVAYARGEWQTAQTHLQHSFHILQKNRALPDLLDVLATYCLLWLQQEKIEEATQLLFFVRQHPSALPLSQRAAAQMLTMLQGQVPGEQFGILKGIGEAMSLEDAFMLVEHSAQYHERPQASLPMVKILRTVYE